MIHTGTVVTLVHAALRFGASVSPCHVWLAAMTLALTDPQSAVARVNYTAGMCVRIPPRVSRGVSRSTHRVTCAVTNRCFALCVLDRFELTKTCNLRP